MSMNRFCLSLTTAFSLATPCHAQDSPPLSLNPTGAWNIDYGDDSCALRRAFGFDGASVDLEIMQKAPGPYFQVTATASAIGLTGSDARVRFEPDSRAQVPQYFRSSMAGELATISYTDSVQRNVLGSERPYINWSDQQREERERSVDALLIERGFVRDLALRIGEMHVPMEALRTCIVDLYGSWGVDLEAHRALWQPARNQNAREVVNVLTRLVSDELDSRPSVPPVVRVVVGADGRLARCSVDLEEEDALLARRMCDIVARLSRYEPAMIAGRKRITSYDTIVLAD